MKKHLFPSLLLFCLFFTQSCSRSADDTLATTTPAQTQAVTSGAWRVTLFTDSGKDETGNFSGYAFQFNSNGSVSATKGNTTKTGTWSISSNKFNIDLGVKNDSNKPLGELTYDWRIVSIKVSEIKLADDNAASGEALTFIKN